MATRLNPYISFDGDARQAMEFYREVFGGTLTLNTFGEYGDPDAPEADKIMHGMLETDAGITLMAADTPPGMDRHPGDNIAVSLSGEDAGELRGYWEKLSREAPSPSPSRSRCGATSSACVPIASGSAGWSTSPSRRAELRAPATQSNRSASASDGAAWSLAERIGVPSTGHSIPISGSSQRSDRSLSPWYRAVVL